MTPAEYRQKAMEAGIAASPNHASHDALRAAIDVLMKPLEEHMEDRPDIDKDALEEALDCTIEHLEGEHEGKIVIEREKFEQIYDLASQAYHAILPELTELIEAREGTTTGEWEQAPKKQYGRVYRTVAAGVSDIAHLHIAGTSDKEVEANAQFITKAANLITSIAKKVDHDR